MKNLYLLILFLLCSIGSMAQSAIRFPYNFGVHSYLVNENPQKFYSDCKAQGIKYIDIDPGEYGYGSYEQIIAGSQTTKKYMEEYGLATWAIHLPYGNSFDISTTDENRRREIVESLSDYIKALTKVFHPQRFVLHPSGEPVTTSAEREKNIAQAIKSVRALYNVATQKGVVLCIENLPRTCLGNTPEELLRIVTPTPGVKICYDTNHNLLDSYDDFISKTGHLIGTIHVSDYDYTNERHWLPGMGKLPWGDLILMLEECGYDGVFMSESDNNPAHKIPSTEETINSFKAAAEEYEKVKRSPIARLQLYMKGVDDRYLPNDIVAGNKPGQYAPSAVKKYQDIKKKINKAINSGTLTAQEGMQYRKVYRDAVDALNKAINPIENGYYYIKSTHEGFKSRGKEMAMFVDNDHTLGWKAFEPSPHFLFYIKKVGKKEYTIQNIFSKKYICTTGNDHKVIQMSDQPQVNQCIDFLNNNGMLRIFNKQCDVSYHAEDHKDGAGTHGKIIIWNSNPLQGSGSSWRLQKAKP